MHQSHGCTQVGQEDQEAQQVLGSFLLVFSSIPLSGPVVDLDLMEKSDMGLLIIPVMDWPSVHCVSLAQKAGINSSIPAALLRTRGLEKWMDLLFITVLCYNYFAFFCRHHHQILVVPN